MPRLGRRAAQPLVAYAFGATMLGTTLPTPLYPLYQRRLGFSELIVTVIFATYAVGVIAGLLLFGRLSDRIGRRPTLGPGIALSAASAVAFLAAGSLGPLLVGRLLSGLSAGIFTGTATATLVELAPRGGRGRATLAATLVNMVGLGCGPLLAGLLAQYATLPLRLPFAVHLGLLLPAAFAVLAMPETVEDRGGGGRLRPQRLRVPPEVRATFVPAAIAGFAGFAVLGLFTAVAPAFLGKVLHLTQPAVTGAVVFAIFAGSATGQLGLERIATERALPAGCAGLIAGMGLVAGALGARSLAMLVAGAVVAGLGQGLSFRAGLDAVNGASPAEQRGEVASSFFVVCYVAISIPVIGEGIAAQATSLRTAGIVFAIGVIVLAAVAVGALLARRGAPAAAGEAAPG